MIQGLPEKEPSPAAKPAAAPPDLAAPQARLTDLYEQEVIDFVAERLDEGDTESEVIEALRPHDFRYEEARQLVRAVAKGRPRSVAKSPAALKDDFLELLQENCPDMQPLVFVPSLGTINGVGWMVYGGRDFDSETGTYVKTHVFTIAFIPLFAIAAYRVADAANGGWYFLGTERLSPFARNWNWIFPISIVGILFVILLASINHR